MTAVRALLTFFLLSGATTAGFATSAVPRVLFVAGEPSHGPGEHRFPDGCALLAQSLNDAGISARVSAGWPAAAEFGESAVIVLYSDGLGRHVANGHLDELRQHVRAGKGLVVLHFALEPERGALAEFLLEAVGGVFEEGWSVNPVWRLEQSILPPHEVTRGVAPFEIEDEWYYHLRFRPGIMPVLQAVPPAGSLGEDGPRSGNPTVRAAVARQEPQTLAWVFEQNGHRAFGFTGGHFHRNWADENFRRLVLNGIVWCARESIPARGIISASPALPYYTTIDEAIARGDIDDVRRHLAADPDRIRRGATASLAPLHQAILRNRTEIVLLLLEAGADVNEPDRSQRTPLHLAVERGNVAVVEALVAKAARPNARDRIGWTPLHHAAAKDRTEIAQALLRGGADPRTLSAAGGTALHEAAASGSAAMVRLLLEAGVDPAVVSSTGVTALDVAREFKNEAAIQMLDR